MDQREAEANGDGGEAFGGALVGGSEDDQEKEGGEDDFGYEASEKRVVVWGVLGEAVRGESASEGEAGFAVGDDKQDP